MVHQTAFSKGLRILLQTALVTMVPALRRPSRAAAQLLSLYRRLRINMLRCQIMWTGVAHTADATPRISAILEHASSHAARTEPASPSRIPITGLSVLAVISHTWRVLKLGRKHPRSFVVNVQPSLRHLSRSQRSSSGIVDEQRLTRPHPQARARAPPKGSTMPVPVTQSVVNTIPSARLRISAATPLQRI
jgi:hypothetical protein